MARVAPWASRSGRLLAVASLIRETRGQKVPNTVRSARQPSAFAGRGLPLKTYNLRPKTERILQNSLAQIGASSEHEPSSLRSVKTSV